jgi:hypothetical protein
VVSVADDDHGFAAGLSGGDGGEAVARLFEGKDPIDVDPEGAGRGPPDKGCEDVALRLGQHASAGQPARGESGIVGDTRRGGNPAAAAHCGEQDVGGVKSGQVDQRVDTIGPLGSSPICCRLSRPGHKMRCRLHPRLVRYTGPCFRFSSRGPVRDRPSCTCVVGVTCRIAIRAASSWCGVVPQQGPERRTLHNDVPTS